jgi:hypothetical protein
MTSYAAVIYFYFLPTPFDYSETPIPLLTIFLLLTGTVFFPGISVLLMRRASGITTNLQMEDPRERNWPLLQTSIVYAICYWFMRNPSIPEFIKLFLLGATCSLVLILIINLRWKISMHTAGIGGLCGGITTYMFLSGNVSLSLLSLVFLLAGITGTARLLLNAHTPAQVYAGFFLGFVIEFGILIVLF